MTTLSTLAAEIRSVEPGYPALEFEVQTDPPAPTGLRLDLDVLDVGDQIWITRQDDAAGGAAAITQAVFARLIAKIPGQGEVTTTEFLDGFEVMSSVGDTSGMAWRLSLPASDEDRPHGLLGWAKHYQGFPPPGACADLVIEIVYVTNQGVEISCVVLEGGIPVNASRTIEFEDPRSQRIRHVLEISGVGPEGKLDLTPIEYQLAVSHGKTHGAILGELAVLAGMAAADLAFGAELGSALNNPLDVADGTERAWPLTQEVARGAGYWLQWSGSTLGAVPIATIDEAIGGTFTSADLVKTSGWQEDSDGSTPTLVRVISSEIKRGPDSDGDVTVILTQETYGPYVLPVAGDFQSNTPPYVFTTGLADLDLGALALVRRVTRERTTVDGCETRIRTITERWRNLRAARYQTDTAGAINSRKSGYFFGGSVVDGDSADLFVWDRERFIVDSDDLEVITRDGNGREITRESFEGRWVEFADHRQQDLTPPRPWTGPFAADSPVLGNLAGVLFDAERFCGPPRIGTGGPMLRPTDDTGEVPGAYDSSERRQNVWAAITTVSNQADEANLMTAKTTEREAFVLRDGEDYWYTGGATSQDEAQYGQIESRLEETWQDSQEGQFLHVSTKTDQNGRVPANGSTVETFAGGRPGIPICTQDLIDLEASQGTLAERSIPAGECRPIVEHEETARFAEGEDLTNDLAERLLRWYTAQILIFSVPVVAPLTSLVGRRWAVDFPSPVEHTGDGWIEKVRHWSAAGDDGRPRMYSEITFRRRLV